jgi:hypothetical protein
MRKLLRQTFKDWLPHYAATRFFDIPLSPTRKAVQYWTALTVSRPFPEQDV